MVIHTLFHSNCDFRELSLTEKFGVYTFLFKSLMLPDFRIGQLIFAIFAPCLKKL